MSYTVDDLDNGVRKWAFNAWTEAQKNDTYVEYLDEDYESWEDIDESQAWEALHEEVFYYGKTAYIPGAGDIILVRSQGGGEGGGEDYHLIVRVTSERGVVRAFKRNGWYASYSGGRLEGPTVEGKIVVKPVEVFE